MSLKGVKEAWISFRIDPSEKVRLELKAAGFDPPLRLSQVFRLCCTGVLKRGEAFLYGAGAAVHPADRKAIQQLAHQVKLAGNLLNQLLRQINIVAKTGEGAPPTEAEIRRAVLQLEEVGSEAARLLRASDSSGGAPQ